MAKRANEGDMIFDAYNQKKDSRLNPALFWEYDLAGCDWQAMRRTVVQRVVERGDWSDFYAMLNLYGKEGVRKALKEEINYLSDRNIAFASLAFDIDKNEMKCYTRKQSRQGHWNS